MAGIQRQEKAQIIHLDPKFMAVAGAIWSVFKFFFLITKSIIYFAAKLCLRSFGKNSKEFSIPEVEASREIKIKNSAKEESFLHYGGLKWFSLYTQQALKLKNVKSHPKGTAVSFGESELSIFGDLYEDHIKNIEDSIDRIILELKLKEISIKEVHLLKELGKYLDKNGVPDREIIGFSMDSAGACLMHEEAAQDSELCYKYFYNILKEEQNRNLSFAKARDTLWNQPDTIKERLKFNREFQESDNKRKYGTFRGRPIIDLDSPISDGVYLGASGREAIYINKDNEHLIQIYKNFLAEIRKIKDALGPAFEEQVFKTALNICRKTFPHNTQNAVNKIRQEHRLNTDQEVELGFFTRLETGDSEHQSLLLAWLLETLKKDQPNYFSAAVSIDRNWIPGGGHAWVRCSYEENNIYIIDAFKNYIGRLDNYSSVRWPYERRKDLNNLRISRPL